MVETVAATFAITPRDRVRILLLFYGPKGLALIGVAASICLAWIIFDDELARHLSRPAYVAVTSAIGFMTGIVGTFLAGILLVGVILPLLRRKKAPTLLSITADGDGVQLKSAVTGTRFAWLAFRRAVSNENISLLYYGSILYIAVPLRAFATEAERFAFLELVRSNVARFDQR